MNISQIRAPRAPGTNPACAVDIDPKDFPDQPNRGEAPPTTIDNVRFMVDRNGITVRYNVIKKRTEIIVPWLMGTAKTRTASR